MRSLRGALLPAAAAWALGASPAEAVSTLAVHDAGRWRVWWRSDQAPERWAAPEAQVAGALGWRRLGHGVEWATVPLAGSAPAWRTKLIVVRLDPDRVRLTLELALSTESGRPAWSIERAPAAALVAVNAGQFLRSMPWGWLVMDGTERLAAGAGPLSVAVAVDRDGAVRWLPPDSLAGALPRVAHAFQSYPVLLERDGTVPAALRAPGRGVDLGHRDARLALGQTREGRLLIVMTRFAALGEVAEAVPIGPTTPEMAAILGALGARDAVMLDGGISAQMMVREPGGRVLRWPGMRKVPLALIVSPRLALRDAPLPGGRR